MLVGGNPLLGWFDRTSQENSTGGVSGFETNLVSPMVKDGSLVISKWAVSMTTLQGGSLRITKSGSTTCKGSQHVQHFWTSKRDDCFIGTRTFINLKAPQVGFAMSGFNRI